MAQRELLTSILEANLALVSVRQNQVVQTISAWAAIIAVPTFFASIWGMNFEHMPELKLSFGYPLALLAMVFATLLLHRFFKADRLALDGWPTGAPVYHRARWTSPPCSAGFSNSSRSR